MTSWSEHRMKGSGWSQGSEARGEGGGGRAGGGGQVAGLGSERE